MRLCEARGWYEPDTSIEARIYCFGDEGGKGDTSATAASEDIGTKNVDLDPRSGPGRRDTSGDREAYEDRFGGTSTRNFNIDRSQNFVDTADGRRVFGTPDQLQESISDGRVTPADSDTAAFTGGFASPATFDQRLGAGDPLGMQQGRTTYASSGSGLPDDPTPGIIFTPTQTTQNVKTNIDAVSPEVRVTPATLGDKAEQLKRAELASVAAGQVDENVFTPSETVNIPAPGAVTAESNTERAEALNQRAKNLGSPINYNLDLSRQTREELGVSPEQAEREIAFELDQTEKRLESDFKSLGRNLEEEIRQADVQDIDRNLQLMSDTVAQNRALVSDPFYGRTDFDEESRREESPLFSPSVIDPVAEAEVERMLEKEKADREFSQRQLDNFIDPQSLSPEGVFPPAAVDPDPEDIGALTGSELRTRLEAETLQGLTPQQQGIASSLRDLGISDSAIRAGIAPEGTLPGDEQRGLFFADLETAATERPLVKNPFEGTPFVSGQIGADVVNTFTRPDAKVEEIIRRGGQPILDENGFIVGAFDTNTQRVIARSGEMFNPALKPFYDKQRAAEAQERESRGENDEPMLSAEDLPPQEDAPEVVEGRNIVSSPGYQPRGPLSIAYTGLPSLAPTVLRPTYTPQTTFSPLFPLGQRRSR